MTPVNHQPNELEPGAQRISFKIIRARKMTDALRHHVRELRRSDESAVRWDGMATNKVTAYTDWLLPAKNY
jgi:hypothetical protein